MLWLLHVSDIRSRQMFQPELPKHIQVSENTIKVLNLIM